jgi:hypothetical protein
MCIVQRYFSFITGFGRGLEGQDIGFLESTTIHSILVRDLYLVRLPYLLLIPMEGSWYSFKQK